MKGREGSLPDQSPFSRIMRQSKTTLTKGQPPGWGRRKSKKLASYEAQKPVSSCK